VGGADRSGDPGVVLRCNSYSVFALQHSDLDVARTSIHLSSDMEGCTMHASGRLITLSSGIIL